MTATAMLLDADLSNCADWEALLLSQGYDLIVAQGFDTGHSARVSRNAERFGKCLGLSQSDLDTLRIGGLVHDIGKIGIPEAILTKPGPLDFEESRIVEQHTIIGEQICAPLKSFRRVLPLIRHHHERMNGTGYPDGLSGDEIPLIVRVLQIVDIYDALTSDRSYRQTMSLPSALTVLYQEAARGWLDEDLVRQFAPIAGGSERPAGLGNRSRSRNAERAKWSAGSSRSLVSHRRT